MAKAESGMTRRTWLAYLAGALVVALCLAAGLWQLRRHDAKLALQAAYASAANAMPVTRSEQLAAPRRVVLQGRWRAAGTVFLDNRSYRGRPGFQVLTPLLLNDGGGAVMVNRGWLPLGADRRQLPAVATPSGPVEVSGRVVAPVEGGFTLGESAAEPRIWQRIDARRFAAQAGQAAAAVYVEQDNAAPDALVRDWAPPEFGADRHLGYAWQWFAFAVMTIGWMLWSGWRTFKTVSR